MPDSPTEFGYLNKTGLQRIYSPVFRGANLHHLVPKTRNGRGTEYNLFPYEIRRHSAYHDIFFNLRIDEVWNRLNRIHYSVFESGDNNVTPWWIDKCEREVGTTDQIVKFNRNKEGRLSKAVSADWLQNKWFKAFGSEDRKASREFLRLMMLFMVFGTRLLDKETLFDNSNLSDFIERTSCTNMRLWAFEKCFGQAGTVHSLKAKIVSVVDRFDYYSGAIL